MDEIRVTDPSTGGQKGSKLARFSLIPREFLWELACHYGRGARKYADRNWERGYSWYLSQDAMERHFNQWLMGEDNDEETGTNHLICAIWHLVALYVFQMRGLGTDDIRTRTNPPQAVGRPGTAPAGGGQDTDRTGLHPEAVNDAIAAS